MDSTRRDSTRAAASPTDLAAKKAYVRKAKQTRGHICHWPGCDKDVPPAMWGCKTHWFKLPKNLRDRIWATYQPGQEEGEVSVSEAYFVAADAVEAWIKENANVR